MRFKWLAKTMMALLKPLMIGIAKEEESKSADCNTPLLLGHPWLINAYMQARFTYVTDRELFGVVDRPQTAVEMLQREKGDCEDWAEVARALLAPVYEPYLFYVSVRDKGEGKTHMVCVFSEGGKYSYIHTAGYRRKIVLKRANALIPAEIDLASRIAADVYPGALMAGYGRAVWNGERWQPVGA